MADRCILYSDLLKTPSNDCRHLCSS